MVQDASETSWLAFKAPREVGRLSFWAIRTLEAWRYLLFAGLGLLLLELATCCFGDHGSVELDLAASPDPATAQSSRGRLATGGDKRTE